MVRVQHAKRPSTFGTSCARLPPSKTTAATAYRAITRKRLSHRTSTVSIMNAHLAWRLMTSASRPVVRLLGSGLNADGNVWLAAVWCSLLSHTMRAHFMPSPSMRWRGPYWALCTAVIHPFNDVMHSTSELERLMTIFTGVSPHVMTCRQNDAVIETRRICGERGWCDVPA